MNGQEEGGVKAHKMSVVMRVSEESVAHYEGFEQRGRIEHIPLTNEDRAAHKRAVDAMAELESNPWAFNGWEGYELEPLEPRTRFIPEETTEEWLARWRASKEES